MMCIEGVMDPDLKDKDLQKHFGVDNAKDLCEKLFGNEINALSDEISRISGVAEADGEDTEDEVKN